MSRRRRTSSLKNLSQIVGFFILVGISSFAAFWKSLTKEFQDIILILVVTILISGTALVILWLLYRKRQREQAWRSAMINWAQSRQENRSPLTQTARFFSPTQLEKFAAQLFKQMGYRVAHTGQSGDHGVDVHLINPNGKAELVQCKQWRKPVGEPEVRDLAGAMMHEHAVRGFIFAPGGFTQAARAWARGKNIILADEREISRLVESAYGKH